MRQRGATEHEAFPKRLRLRWLETTSLPESHSSPLAKAFPGVFKASGSPRLPIFFSIKSTAGSQISTRTQVGLSPRRYPESLPRRAPARPLERTTPFPEGTRQETDGADGPGRSPVPGEAALVAPVEEVGLRAERADVGVQPQELQQGARAALLHAHDDPVIESRPILCDPMD